MEQLMTPFCRWRLLWLKALHLLHHLMLCGWSTFEDGKTFVKCPNGIRAWYTYFKPDNYGRNGKWYGFGGENITIGDDILRSALVAQHFGMTEQVVRFQHWLKPMKIPCSGAITYRHKQPKFLQDTPYFDVVCTGLLRSWYRQLGDNALANKCQQVFLQTQSANGGWAVTQQGPKPLNQQQAMVTGAALVDVDGVW